MPIHLLVLHLLLSQRPLAEVAAVVEVNTNTGHIVAVGSASPGLMWNRCSNMWSSVASFLGSELWSCATCTSSDCAISAKLYSMPIGAQCVSKLILSMSVSVILG
ncbi:hypothetical protein EDB84DRAFT_1508903 [Lactarius hengduanensis]|nr:hypothetical protein EDB84DRAFT_1508903 [Lactarius hengduanensis]